VKELLERFLNKKVRLVKDDSFVIYGVITKVADSSIIFYSDGREILISFNRIKEVVPLNYRRGLEH